MIVMFLVHIDLHWNGPTQSYYYCKVWIGASPNHKGVVFRDGGNVRGSNASSWEPNISAFASHGCGCLILFLYYFLITFFYSRPMLVRMEFS